MSSVKGVPVVADSLEASQPGSNLGLWSKRIGLISGPIAFALILSLKPFPLEAAGNAVVASFAWMLIWWVSEAVPLAATALLPIVLFSLTGVMKLDEALIPYSNKIIYLFFGGFILALGLEEHGLHKRIALEIIRLTGVSPRRLVLGFLLATAAISMWISNTATAVMMLPMALSVLNLLLDQPAENDQDRLLRQRFSSALILSVAYGSNIGGIGTLIGTPPNLVLRGYFEDQLNIEISFLNWMLTAMPIAMALLAFTYLILVFFVFPIRGLEIPKAATLIENERKRLGPMTMPQWKMLAVFATTAGLWIFRELIVKLVPGLPLTDEIIAVSAAILLFVIPADWDKGQALLNWEATKRLPWGILLLFGGGLCLADAFQRTGVLQALVDYFSNYGKGQIFLTMIILTAFSIYVTEVMSNVALTQVLVPIVCGLAIGLDLNPIYFAFPVALGSSCAFMLPMSTPPNAIVFSSGHISVRQMIIAGFWLNITSVITIGALAWPLLYLFQ